MSPPDLTQDFEYQLRQFMLIQPDITAIAGSRIFPAPAPQNTPAPYITFQRITAEREYTLEHYTGLCGAMIQIDCWSDAPEYAGSYGAAKLLGIAVRQALNAYRGFMGPLRVQETTIDSERDTYEAQDHTRRISFDMRFWYDED